MIIKSMLDTDLYKFTMQQAVLHRFPEADAEFTFKCRNENINLSKNADQIIDEIKKLCTLKFTKEELDLLSRIRFLRKDYIDFLRIFQFNFDYIKIEKEKKFTLRIKGPWLHTILFEVPILAIINEVYFRSFNYDKNKVYNEGMNKLNEKIEFIKASNKEKINFRFADFGTRRRFSGEWHEQVIKKLKNDIPENFTGTSNVFYAMKYNLKPIGTMAHEWLQAGQALGVKLAHSQKFMLENWVQEYRGDLGIALSDVVGMEAFLRDFDLYFMKLFDGARHDSGDPFDWCEKLISHYKAHNIDPMTKLAVFSDSLTFPLAINLAKKYKNTILTYFGIGTNLTNDVGYTPIQIVIKMTRCNNSPVAKISDSSGKGMCEDENFLLYLKSVFNIK